MNPVTKQLTAAEKTSAELCRLAKMSLDAKEAAWRGSYNLIWNNPFGLTPKQAIDILGTDAVDAFTESYQTGEYLKAHGRLVGVTNAAPVPYTANADGTITLTPPAQS